MTLAPIRTEEAHRNALQLAATLMTKGDAKSRDELEVLQMLVERWETSRDAAAPPTPIEAVRFRMAQLGLQPRDLIPYIGSRSRVSEVLSGTRSLTLDMIRALHGHLGVPLASLVGDTRPEPPKRRAAPSAAAMEKLAKFDVMRKGERLASFLARAFGESGTPAMLRKTRTDRTNAKTDLAALEVWCAAALVKAEERSLPKGRPRKCSAEAGRELAKLSAAPDGPTKVADQLARSGIAFVTLDHLPGTFLDGAALRTKTGVPVIALTLRHDRVDNFWFTLLHEYAHVCLHLSEDRMVILDDMEVKGVDGIEDEADAFAQEALIPAAIWQRAKSPDLTGDELEGIAGEAGIHPAIVAGRWQREHNDYRKFSKALGRGEIRRLFA